MINSKQFFKYLQDPGQLTESSVVEIEQLIKQFPFFQTAHLLYLKSLKKINKKLVSEKLPVESLYIADRKKLYGILEEDDSYKSQLISKATNTKEDTENKASNGKTFKVVTPESVTTQTKETKDSTQGGTTVTKETKTVTVSEGKTENAPNIKKKNLTAEERKNNHDNLVKDFFDERQESNYQTVATNIAEDGSIKSAAADFAKEENVSQAVIRHESRASENKPSETPKPQVETKTQVIETKTVETKTIATKVEEKPKVVETKTVETKVEEKPKVEETKTVETKVEEKPKDNILDKIASLRKEKDEVNKKLQEEELVAKKAKEEAEKAAAAAVITTTTTVVKETVTTVTEKKPADKETELLELEKPVEKPAEKSAAEKLLARLERFKDNKNPETSENKIESDSLIDKFLKEDPHIDRNKEVVQGDMGEDSVKQPELYSEKLAKLYITQKLYDKALASYEKLKAKYPEKESYFAEKIEEIQQLKKNNQ
ncbi:MAG: hypothetical protein IKR41_06355 [Bacteroidales bacterium]|nr:hypothetical protein [Bacteroidales bacterium]